MYDNNNNERDILKDFIEIRQVNEDEFLKIKETLTRIGVPSYRTNTLYQSCHILHKKNRYYICHFKELFKLDGRPTNMSNEDRLRRNAIANRLQAWGLCEILNDTMTDDDDTKSRLKVVKYSEKHKWNLESKYTIGAK